MIADMRVAAAEDRDLNNAGKPATKKMGMLRVSVSSVFSIKVPCQAQNPGPLTKSRVLVFCLFVYDFGLDCIGL